jgi:hypothetical protein
MHRAILGAGTGQHVHHRNGNKLDNQRENLQLMEAPDHLRQHAAHLVSYAKSVQKYPDVRPCVSCGAEFRVNPRKRSRHCCCSRACAMAQSIAGRKRQALTCKTHRKRAVVPQVVAQIGRAILAAEAALDTRDRGGAQLTIAVPTNTTHPNPEANDARACSPVEASAVECSGSAASGPPAVNPGSGHRSTGAPVEGHTGALYAHYCELQR